ncbi:hypothetical protein C1645_838034 [Glomus cerebriforme]|uniref:Uncharacterized protein n=1 Tax=Glomus cerebriforme TaxID=658196 RepID=A0A397S324_9GLOM|nr:hypothetical protein C1645_838034 [Glomus cerebriforme]
MSSIINTSDIEEYLAEDFVELGKDNNDEIESKETYAFFTFKLRVSRVIHTTVLIEYPDTFSEGVAIVYNITG